MCYLFIFKIASPLRTEAPIISQAFPLLFLLPKLNNLFTMQVALLVNSHRLQTTGLPNHQDSNRHNSSPSQPTTHKPHANLERQATLPPGNRSGRLVDTVAY